MFDWQELEEAQQEVEEKMFSISASVAAEACVIVKLARPFSGEEDLFKHMVSFL